MSEMVGQISGLNERVNGHNGRIEKIEERFERALNIASSRTKELHTKIDGLRTYFENSSRSVLLWVIGIFVMVTSGLLGIVGLLLFMVLKLR